METRSAGGSGEGKSRMGGATGSVASALIGLPVGEAGTGTVA